jgi:hypothetical protein
LAAERAALGNTWYSQEYENLFCERVDAVFRMEDVARAVTDEVKPLFEGAVEDNIKPLEAA